MKLMFCILGKSSVGKDTIINAVTTSHSNLSKVIPTTTRPMRACEKNGHDYIFMSENSFMKKVENDQFMEYRQYDVLDKNGKKLKWYYGTAFPNQPVSICTGSLEMYSNIIKNPKVSENIKVYPIYITVPEHERLFRMINRERRNQKPNFREVSRRYVQDNIDFSDEKCTEVGITEECTFINTDREEAINNVINYINSILEKESLM